MMLTVCLYVSHSATDVHTICYISNANLSARASHSLNQRRYCTFSTVMYRDMHQQRERDAKRRAGSQLLSPAMGVIANRSQ